MDLVARYFYFDGGKVHRCPGTHFKRLLDDHPDEYLPECAGRRIKFAIVHLLSGVKPGMARVLGVTFAYYTFTAEGRLDQDELHRGLALVKESLNDEGPEGNLLDMRPRLARNRFIQDFAWDPMPCEIDALKEAVENGKRAATS